MSNQLDRVLAEIDANTTLTERDKLAQKAAAVRDWRAINNHVVVTRGYADRTSLWRAFGLAFMRAMGRALARGLSR